MNNGLTLIQGKKEFCRELANGARIFYRRLPLPIFVNFVRGNLLDDRTGKTDWQQVAEKGALYAITRWENVFDEDGNTPAECNEENKAMLPPQVLGDISRLAIEHLKESSKEATEFAREIAAEGSPDPLANTTRAPEA
ncbi:hypothetical protein KKH18_07030 [bacterium]|nr:hypothetical protein [bacterium]